LKTQTHFNWKYRMHYGSTWLYNVFKRKEKNHKRNFSRFAAKLPAFTRYRVSVVLVRGTSSSMAW